MIGSELANVDAIVLFGTSQPAPKQRKLTAGSLTATWEQGALRNICYDGVEVLRGIAFRPEMTPEVTENAGGILHQVSGEIILSQMG